MGAVQQVCLQEGFQISQGGAALQKEWFEKSQSPGKEILKQVSRKGGSDWKRNTKTSECKGRE